MLQIRHLIASVAFIAVGFLASRAETAPQILGLVASNGTPTPLQCQNGFCAGYLASFCLQEARDAPATGQEYALGKVGGITLVVTRPDGRRLRLPTNDLLTLRLRSGFSVVRITIPQIKLDALGVRTAEVNALAVEIEPETTILPVVAAGDPDPQSPEEIAQATGPLRHLAAETFDRSGELSDAARLVGLLTNALPPEDGREPVALDSLFRHVLASVGPERLDPDGITEAERIAKSCQILIHPPTNFALAACLDREQVSLLTDLNNQFWAAAGGS
jgi:hypothetical protein